MGLTVHYEFSADVSSLDEAADLLAQLHRVAKELPFAEVGDLQVFDETAVEELAMQAEAEPEGFTPARMLLCQASRLAKDPVLKEHLGEHGYHSVDAECFCEFTVYPGEGSETASIGLGRAPATTTVDGKTWQTGLSDWGWHSFCKTQYASNPKFGGIEHFLKCHLGLIDLLDHADSLGILNRVGDDSEYWEHRDQDRLRAELEKMNRLVASFVGAFNDQIEEVPGKSVAPITEFPNFEHLEADGQQRNPDTDDQP